jgi:hypothetical protein
MLKKTFNRKYFADNLMFFDSDWSFSRVGACIYSYNRTLKKNKSFIFLDFGLKRRDKEDFYNVYTFFSEAFKTEFLFLNRLFEFLPFSSLGFDCISFEKQLKDYWGFSRYDLMQNILDKYAGPVVDILSYPRWWFSKHLFYNKCFDIDKFISDFYPINFNKLQKQMIIIRNFTTYWSFYVNENENISLNFFNKFYKSWFCRLKKKNQIQIFENVIFRGMDSRWGDIYFLKMNRAIFKILLKNMYIFLSNILNSILLLYRFMMFKFLSNKSNENVFVISENNEEFIISSLIFKIFGIKSLLHHEYNLPAVIFIKKYFMPVLGSR